MGAITDLINEAFPITATDGNDLLGKFEANLRVSLGTNPISNIIINSILAKTNQIWNSNIISIDNITVEENIIKTKQALMDFSESSLEAKQDPFGFGSFSDFVEDVADIIPDIPNPFAALEWLQKNWLLIVVAIVVAIIIIIIVFSIFVTQPLMEAVMIGALS